MAARRTGPAWAARFARCTLRRARPMAGRPTTPSAPSRSPTRRWRTGPASGPSAACWPASTRCPPISRAGWKALARRLPDLLPARPAPSLLHGDLWAGNVLFGGGGVSGLIDPACYYGDGEVDLAMLHLFGAPGPGFAEGYGALAPGAAERRAIYQLWPAITHLRLFGAGYRGMVEGLLARVA
jgi:hypothetical protein